MKAKRFLLLIPVLILALMLSGCIQTVVSLDIRNDLSADVDIKTGIDEDYYDMAGGAEAFSESNFGESDGFIVSEYSEGGYKGVESKGTVKNITEYNSMLNSIFGDDYIHVDPEKGTLIFRAPISGVQNQIAGQSGYSLSELESYGKPDMRIIITFPYDIKESNATSVSGRTLTWDLLEFEGSEMYAFTEGGGPGFAMPVWLIIVIIIAAAAVVVFLLLRYLKKKNSAPANAGYGGPVNPAANVHKDRYNGPSYNDPGFGQQETAGQPSAEDVLTMAFCPQCGTKLPEGGLFCPECGHKLRS